jgi:diguanylate cyclase (GGDEF)-like protein/PAS domain S-box-containing protein
MDAALISTRSGNRNDARRSQLADVLPIAVVEYDGLGKVTAWNSAASKLFGWTCDEAMGTCVPTLPASQQNMTDVFAQVTATRETVEWDASVLTKTGESVDVTIYVAPLVDDHTGQCHTLCSVIDRRPYQQAIDELRASEHRFRSMVDHARDIVFEITLDGEITFVSDAFQRTFGVPATDFLGLNVFAVMKDACFDLGEAAKTSALRGDDEFRYTFHIPEFDRWMEVGAVRSYDVQGTCLRVSGVMCDVTDRHRREVELTLRAERDSLTGVLNREAFGARLDDMMAAHPDRLISVCFFDLDHFKALNDSWGHEFGDQVLTLVARALEAGSREGDLIGRLGGDEFLVASGPLAEAADGHDVAQRLLARLAAPITINAMDLTLEASVGVAVGSRDGGARSRTLIRDADHEMYKVKHGRPIKA